MGYYIDIETRNPGNLTLEELDQRFLDAGCQPSPAREDDTIEENKREFYAHEIWIDLGTLNLYTCEETGHPIGHIRVSWSTHPEDFREDLEGFLRIAESVGAVLLDGELGEITAENLTEVVARFTKGSALIRRMLGGSPPIRRSKCRQTWDKLWEALMS